MSALRDLSQRIRNVVSKAIVEAVVDSDALQVLRLEILDSEDVTDIERIQNYGLTSNPPKDSEAVVVEAMGTRDNLVAIAVDNSASRIKDLLDGEVCLYSKHGQKLVLNSGAEHVFDEGARKVSAVNDTTEVNTTTDSNIVTWMSLVNTALLLLNTSPTVLSGFTNVNPPVTITGKITSGTEKVKVP